jgi:CubicO group peptidase (beta-lactamase class C family)/tetratricopeptide (TPR) repeat protein
MLRNIQKSLYLPFLLFCISSLGLVCFVTAQEKAAPAVRPTVDYSSIIAQLKERLPEHMAKANVPGLAIALVDGDKLVWAEGFGYTDRTNQTKVTADTLFSLQSISKTYTATGFLIAMEKGLIKLDDPLKKYYPQFTVKSRFGADEANRITLRHLLGHWSGITHEAPCGNNSDARGCPFADHIRSISETWLKFPVGERYSYSNLGIDLAGYAMERCSGKPFDEFLNDELFRPLGMTSSTFNHKVAASHPSLAKGHTRDRILPVTPIPMIPAGGMYSTVKDMARYISFHLAGGKIGGKQIIGETLLKEMYSPQFSIEGQFGGYGLGIVSEPLRNGIVLHHGGGGYGYKTYLMWAPEYRVGVVVLTNSTSSDPYGTAVNVLLAMIKVKYGPLPKMEPRKPTDKPIITMDTKLLQRLTGTYKPRGSVVTFKVKEDGLYRVSGTTEVKLNAHSPTEFTIYAGKYTFILDEKGRPKGVQHLLPSGAEFMPFNDSPGEEAGPDKKEWQDFVGEYSCTVCGGTNTDSVMIKNGYLYLRDNGGLKLFEYKPGIFFTADGEAVIFQDDRMYLSNTPFLKKSAKTSLNIPQSTVTQPADKYADKLRIFEEFVRKQMEKDKIPGLTIGFYKDDYTWVKGFGYADLENKVPAKPESAYRLASVTKPFTSAAILQLVEKGKIKLDAEIQTYVPYYPKQQWPVTVRQLLAHTGGGPVGSGLGPEYVSPREVVERIAKYPITYEPGTKYQYTTSGYNLLGAAIEEVSGKSFNDYLRENIFLPLGMNDTRMNNERQLIPNRVRTYERVNGQIRVAQFIDVSTRFGGGGLIGTIPDLLKWSRGLDAGKVLSKDSLELVYGPVALKDGRYADADREGHYYSLGWHINGMQGGWYASHGGGQIGTATAFLRFPSKNMAIAFATNTHGVYDQLFIRRLYELVTDEPWEIPVYTKDQASRALYDGLKIAFNFGGAWFDKRREPFTNDPQELSKAFEYFNRAVNLGSLQSNYQATRTAIDDGIHPVADSAFFKVGSFIAAKLREKHGAERDKTHRTMGAISFFADYIKLYQSQSNIPKEHRFNEAFEKIITKWNEDWTRTWNDYTRNLNITAESDFDEIGKILKPLFATAEVYPNFIGPLLANQKGVPGLKAIKLTVDLYPQSSRANGNWGLVLMLINRYPEERKYLKEKIGGEPEEAMPYFKKSLELEPDGIAGPRILWDEIGRKWLDAGRVDDTLILANLALQLHPKEARFHAGMCEVYLRKGMKERATEACKRALEIDPNSASAHGLMKKLHP